MPPTAYESNDPRVEPVATRNQSPEHFFADRHALRLFVSLDASCMRAIQQMQDATTLGEILSSCTTEEKAAHLAKASAELGVPCEETTTWADLITAYKDVFVVAKAQAITDAENEESAPSATRVNQVHREWVSLMSDISATLQSDMQGTALSDSVTIGDLIRPEDQSQRDECLAQLASALGKPDLAETDLVVDLAESKYASDPVQPPVRDSRARGRPSEPPVDVL